jgi:cell division protein FtsI (penicillin-binding protein 3)
MRAMMQGIVIEGTGKAAQLNGYSAGGKTGTANKIDPATHTFSHTKLVASFAGFAPVSAPAVSIAVVIDTPTIGSFYGAAVSAPVFHDVAQQVLEYLGVPHDQPLKTQQQMLEARNDKQVDDVPGQQVGDLTAMFDEVNSLPADDPLRQPATAAAIAENAQADAASDAAARAAHAKPPAGLSGLPDKVMEAFHANGNTTSVMPDAAQQATAKVEAPKIRPPVEAQNGGVVIDAGKRVAVPEFKGDGLRMVVQDAGRLGLRVQTLGSGLAREQAPAAGTMVPLGTEIVVRFAR